LRIEIQLWQVDCLLACGLIESFYRIEKENTDGACKKMMKQKKEVCYCLCVVEEDNEE